MNICRVNAELRLLSGRSVFVTRDPCHLARSKTRRHRGDLHRLHKAISRNPGIKSSLDTRVCITLAAEVERGEVKRRERKKEREREGERGGGSKNQLAHRFPYEYGNHLVTDETHSKRDRDASSVAHVPRCTRAKPPQSVPLTCAAALIFLSVSREKKKFTDDVK